MTSDACGCRDNERLIQELSIPAPGSQPLHFETRYPQSALSQFRLIFWKCAAPPLWPFWPLDACGAVKWQPCSITLDAVLSGLMSPMRCLPYSLVSAIQGYSVLGLSRLRNASCSAQLCSA